MKHPSEEELILCHYRDGHDWQAVKKHLESCEACRTSYEGLERLLSAVEPTPVPQLAEDYTAELWRRLRPLLDERPRFTWRRPFQLLRLPTLPRWALAPGLVALVLAAFFLGQFWPRASRLDSARLRAQIEASLQAELGRVFDAKLQSALDRLRSETAQAIAQQLESASAGRAAILVARKNFDDSWTDFLQSYARDRMEDRREVFALRRDLETVVVEAESKLEQTREQVGHLATLAQPGVLKPRSVIRQ